MGLFTELVSPEFIDKVLSIVLRLPGLFIFDYYYQTYTKEELRNLEHQDYASVINIFMIFQATLFLLLPLKQLIILYKHYISAALIGYAEVYTRHYISNEYSRKVNNVGLVILHMVGEHFTSIYSHVEAVCLNVIVSATVACLLNVKSRFKKIIFAGYAIPVIARLGNIPLEYLDSLHKCSSILIASTILLYLVILIPEFLKGMKHLFRKAHTEMFNNPLEIYIQLVCRKLYVMPQFFVFWCSLLMLQLCRYLYPEMSYLGTTVTYPAERRWYFLILYAVSEICASPLSLVASCITIMYTSWAVLHLTTVVAKGSVDAAVGRMGAGAGRLGTGEGITMALLSLQTGLVDLPMPQRIGAMSVILFIVLGSLIQSMHELMEPLLLALCTAHTRAPVRHARVLVVCAFLFVFPLYMTLCLCRLFDIDFWTLVVVSTCALTSVQVLGALTVYALFMYDALHKDSGWESLDDVVYVARAVTRVLEFIVAVLVVGAGVRESLMLSSEGRPWSWLNGSVLAIHFYFNVYQRLQSGWRSFLLRREAARKIHALPSATSAQLQARAHDVCSICYMQMQSACVTPCTHLFHAPCLKKWLYVQDRCPLCAAHIIFSVDAAVAAAEPLQRHTVPPAAVAAAVPAATIAPEALSEDENEVC